MPLVATCLFVRISCGFLTVFMYFTNLDSRPVKGGIRADIPSMDYAVSGKQYPCLALVEGANDRSICSCCGVVAGPQSL